MKLYIHVAGDSEYQKKLDRFLEAKKAFDKALKELVDAQPHYSFMTTAMADDLEDTNNEFGVHD